MTTQERVIKVVREVLDTGDIELTAETDMADLGADSIDIAEMVMEIEEEFDITFPDEDVDAYKTIGKIVEHIDAQDT